MTEPRPGPTERSPEPVDSSPGTVRPTGDGQGHILDPPALHTNITTVDNAVGVPVDLNDGHGHTLIAEIKPPAEPGQQHTIRYAVCVICTRIPHGDRDLARELMPDAEAAADVQYLSVGIAADAPDDDPEFGVGTEATYRVFASTDWIERARAASNALSVTVETRFEVN